MQTEGDKKAPDKWINPRWHTTTQQDARGEGTPEYQANARGHHAQMQASSSSGRRGPRGTTTLR
eukprot:1951209-Pyramimonas_sp.AAC.1